MQDLPYIPQITEALAKVADAQAAEHKADISQMLTCVAVFTAGMLTSNFNGPSLNAVMDAFQDNVRAFADDMVKRNEAGHAIIAI